MPACLGGASQTGGYWVINEDNEYKNNILVSLQKKLHERRIPPSAFRCFVQQAFQENGNLDPLRLGDYGYSYGLGQWYSKTPARLILQRDAVYGKNGKIDVPGEIERQLTMLADDMATAWEEYDGDIKLAVASHNGPGRLAKYGDSCRWLPAKKGHRWSCYFKDEVNSEFVSSLFIYKYLP